MTIRVMIADDHAMVREAFSVLLNAQPGIEVITTAVDGLEAVAKARELHPDVIVMDIRMPGLNGIDATREITRQTDLPTKILVLTTFNLDEYVYEALRAGASGFLLKNASGVELAEAVRIVAAGEALLSPEITKRLIAEFSRLSTSTKRPTQVRIDELTHRETEVLALVAQGLSNAEIAGELVVAEQTVKTHMGRILQKLQLRDRTQAAVFAYETGLVTPGRTNL
ncbi:MULTISPECIES: response regulator [Streptomyces]|uniref:Two-component system response regulator n=1 Tax=Streptomyces griseus subsp. griseus (strain JCM 4626 / CBS 651.72 / NBRC 13350 / KCC S-0626 / ISP 5235) TaxID=455632 RepID=B1VPS5_STRGG|nr:response regulator transcription factor [Streptomyces griseus]MYR14229.1 response regulator [Streptomyces sp. SID724]MBW3709597.1 DNA-binding response regulator [Streptomyces griseus]SEE22970.1 DNA-binding response regulator, NarL/FixJ family, contains REC and HTH domains [Streptomyces griseus]SQA21839.1 two-component system response regulator [Streptomyces griseus]BAG23825.1 putative two-component system response regulator [Streptomyces griseus subsp. griseus NBRC 13350]